MQKWRCDETTVGVEYSWAITEGRGGHAATHHVPVCWSFRFQLGSNRCRRLEKCSLPPRSVSLRSLITKQHHHHQINIRLTQYLFIKKQPRFGSYSASPGCKNVRKKKEMQNYSCNIKNVVFIKPLRMASYGPKRVAKIRYLINRCCVIYGYLYVTQWNVSSYYYYYCK
jgi:hypothetical protein